MPKDAKIRVVLCPHQKLADNKTTDQTWPSPAGAVVHLTRKSSRSTAAAKDITTGADGEASVELDEGVLYTVQMEGQWAAWELVTTELKADDKAKMPIEVRLVPPREYRLLPVRLVIQDDAEPDGDEKGGADEDAGERHAPAGIPGMMIQVEAADGDFKQFGPSGPAGHVYAWASPGSVEVHFPDWKPDPAEEKTFKPVYGKVAFKLPGATHKKVYIAEVPYEPAREGTTPPEKPLDDAQIAIAPKVQMPSSQPRRHEPLTGAEVMVFLHAQGRDPVFLDGTLGEGEKEVSFPDLAYGYFNGTVVPPATFNGWPVKGSDKPIGNHFLPAGEKVVVPVEFELDESRIEGRVLTPHGTTFEEELNLSISYPGMVPVQVTARKGTFNAKVPTGAPLTIYLAPGAKPTLDKLPLEMDSAKQEVLPPPQVTTVTLVYKHYITGRTVDEHRHPMPYAVVDVFDGPEKVASTVSDQDGYFLVGLMDGGDYIVSMQTEGSQPVTARPVSISSGFDIGELGLRLPRALEARFEADSGETQPPGTGGGTPAPGTTGGTPAPGSAAARGGGNGSGPAQVREAFTDLAAYPVLTEEVSTTGTPGPAPGGLGTAGADYGTVVDQAMRDVLGWRPSADVSGFQAALTGAFQLKQVEGHTEWTWQQRGYAVQADMGALTGAQASIYARAKNALDQILPLLASLTPLNPALYPPQDLEAIRTVINNELQELVGELALEGGPRIQRVDQLFGLLLGDRVGSRNLNPDVVQGNLGTLRDRFGLTIDQIDTVDEERIVTNFRIIAEQVLTLQASWSTDRDLLTPLDPRASFGTILIWLSRSLEAVCDSVSDLTFALDSVFVDAAQRQVLELRFHNEPVLLLSDLLDWVVRASRDEGPRIIQDAGKDGVFAFAPVLRRLRDLIQSTRNAAQHDSRLPDGMRTPRVDRALQVLVTQLGEASDLASQVRRDAPPVIEAALVFPIELARSGSAARSGQLLPTLENLPGSPRSIRVEILGANFRTGASAVLIAQDREDLPELHTHGIGVNPPNAILATFRNPRRVPDSDGVTWLVAVTNEDGSHSNQFPI